MMNVAPKFRLTVDEIKILDERAEMSRAVARAIDMGQQMPYSFRIKANRAKALRKSLTDERWDMCMKLQSGAQSIAELAAAQQRAPSAVESDFARLKKFGIVKLVTESGRKVVRLAPGQFLTPQQSAATARPYSRRDQ